MNKTGRPAKRQDAVEGAIHKIKDMDVRSAMFDLHDRCLLAEKELARAKVLLKTLNPGADVTALLDGRPGKRSSLPEMSDSEIKALEDIVEAFSNNSRLSHVGLTNDGKRVKRKGGTGLHDRFQRLQKDMARARQNRQAVMLTVR